MKSGKKVVLTTLVLLISAGGMLFAGGTPETPELPTTTTGTQYLSPNDDGVKEEATVTFSASLYVKSESGYIPEYGLEILPASGGEAVRRIVKKEKQDVGWFSALFMGYKKFTLERSVTWDGTDKEGNPVADGRYRLRLWIEDPSGKLKEKVIEDFVVDTKAPEAQIVEPESLIISPNGDGNRDTITISHTDATSEALWIGEIRDDEGSTVRTFRWENGTPGDAVWKGRTDEDGSAPAGIYDYVLHSTDRAGNESGEIRLEGIELVREDTPVEVVIVPPAVSPDGDGVQEKAVAHLDQAEKEGIVGWSWKVTDADGATVEEHQSSAQSVPETVTLDPVTPEGEPYAPGTYTFSYTVEYRFGNRASASESFSVDVSPPEVEIEVENPLFSPNGDGNKEQVRVKAEAEEKVSWTGRIVDSDGNEVLSGECETGKRSFSWDGRNESGDRVESGTYTIKVQFTDRAGNVTSIEPLQVELDTTPITLSLSVPGGFSPDGDGARDLLPVTVQSNKHNQVDRWTMWLRPVEGEGSRVYSGRILLPKEVRWDGTLTTKDGGKKQAEEGRYFAVMQVKYLRGDLLKAESDTFRLE
jgi:flagellar hook assembly protein FlgD